VNDAFARVFLRSTGASFSVVGAPFAAIFADFTGLHPSLHAGMVDRFLTVTPPPPPTGVLRRC
jgi:hypothetical protein